MEVPRVSLASLTRAEFIRRFQEPNLPVIITEATKDWRATADWVDQSGRPDTAKLSALFGDDVVTIHGEGGKTRDMRVADYMEWWQQRSQDGTSADTVLYLKDWHVAQRHQAYEAYTTPPCLGEDWLNEHWAAQPTDGPEGTRVGDAGDHRFVYVGPRGSVTRLHADVLFSYSWSANVAGRKLWRLVPAEQRHLVSDAATRPLAHSLAEISAAEVSAGLTPLVVTQEAGELLFVPSGWYHEVENLEDTISINHNVSQP